MRVSAPVAVTIVRHEDGSATRHDHGTGERRPLTEAELARLAERDRRVAAAGLPGAGGNIVRWRRSHG